MSNDKFGLNEVLNVVLRMEDALLANAVIFRSETYVRELIEQQHSRSYAVKRDDALDEENPAPSITWLSDKNFKRSKEMVQSPKQLDNDWCTKATRCI